MILAGHMSGIEESLLLEELGFGYGPGLGMWRDSNGSENRLEKERLIVLGDGEKWRLRKLCKILSRDGMMHLYGISIVSF